VIESLAGRLAIAAEQMHVTDERIKQPGVTADDMQAIGKYLEELAEHGHHLCALALSAVERADPEHPVRGEGDGTDLQAAVLHASAMFGAAIHFAHEAQEAADAMTEGDDS
jgi:hypothetical protein